MTSPTEPTAAEADPEIIAFYKKVLADYEEARREHIYEPVTTLTGTELQPTVTPVPQPKTKTRLKFEPAEGSRAAALLTQLPHLEADKNEAEARLSECKAAIMAEIALTVTDPAQMPDGWSIPADPHGGWPAYNLISNPGKLALDTVALKTEEPQTYEKFTKRGKPYWSLSRVQRQRVKRG